MVRKLVRNKTLFMLLICLMFVLLLLNRTQTSTFAEIIEIPAETVQETTDEYPDPDESFDLMEGFDLEAPADLEEILDSEEFYEDSDNITSLGSISGLIWVTENEGLVQDWDELSDETRDPLAGYPVYIYLADDLHEPLEITKTETDGSYLFENLEQGEYILGIAPKEIDGMEYSLLPPEITEDSKFEIDFGSGAMMAFTGVIELDEGQSVEDINAGMLMTFMEASPTYTTITIVPTGIKDDILGSVALPLTGILIIFLGWAFTRIFFATQE